MPRVRPWPPPEARDAQTRTRRQPQHLPGATGEGKSTPIPGVDLRGEGVVDEFNDALVELVHPVRTSTDE
jgi:hypothetical protein